MNQLKYIIAFGANLGNREETYKIAEEQVKSRIGQIVKASTLIETEPLLLPNEPKNSQQYYLNGAWIVKSSLAPDNVLEILQSIETELGRIRLKKWGARTIDLDIIGIDQQILNKPNLTVPHPEMHKRDFVLIPLSEIWPSWEHPVLKKTAANLLSDLN